jgi:hypothetical protein
MKYILFLLISVSSFGQPLVEGGSGKVWNKKKDYILQDGAVFKYVVDNTNDTARYFQPGEKKYELTVTVREIKPPMPLDSASIDDASPSCVYAGSPWYHFANQPWTQVHYNKTVSFTSVAGASVSTSFSGARFTIWSERAKNKGKFQIYLKSGQSEPVMIGEVDLYKNDTKNNSTKVFDSGVLPYGNYVATCILSGQNPASTEKNLLIDKFVIYK